jgi:hypothetical protein
MGAGTEMSTIPGGVGPSGVPGREDARAGNPDMETVL